MIVYKTILCNDDKTLTFLLLIQTITKVTTSPDSAHTWYHLALFTFLKNILKYIFLGLPILERLDCTRKAKPN